MTAEKEVKYAHRLPPCPDYDMEGVESWLTDLAREGLLLDKDTQFFGFFSFIRTAPQVVKYRLEPAVKQQSFWDGDPGKPKDEAIALYCEMGWEYITRYGDFFIYRSYDPDNRELHTDADIQADALNVLRKRQRSALIWDILLFGLYAIFGILRYPMGLAIAMGTVSMVIFYGYFVIMLLRPAVSFRKLQKMRQRILNGESIHLKKDWKPGALRFRILKHIPDLLFLFILISAFAANISEDANEIKLEEYTGDPPFITVADLNPEGDYEQIDFYTTNATREWSDILFPVNIDWHEFASIEMSDGNTLTGSLDISYHEAVNPALAAQLAEELIRYAKSGKYFTAAEPVDTGSDSIRAYTYLGKYGLNTVLILCRNTVVEAQVLLDDNRGNTAREQWIQLMAERLTGK